jgi:hypothetical protein
MGFLLWMMNEVLVVYFGLTFNHGSFGGFGLSCVFKDEEATPRLIFDGRHTSSECKPEAVPFQCCEAGGSERRARSLNM